ncbi:hypothetical protein HOP50_02g12200 [Chloropicon primus]|nr:hypothetical protein HOP50_02g12200 [Chloropicon primus]
MREKRLGGGKRSRLVPSVLAFVVCLMVYQTSVTSWGQFMGQAGRYEDMDAEEVQAHVDRTNVEGALGDEAGAELGGLEAEPIAEHEFVDPTQDMEKVLFEEKMRLVDAVLAQRIFEVNVSRVPVLQRLFSEFEKAQKYFVKSLRMGDYDKSCDHYYQDSLSGEFDKEFYNDKEFLYKMKHRNITGDLKEPTCDNNAKYGCCTACKTPQCCLCEYDGKKSIVKDVLRRGNSKLQIEQKVFRGITHWNTKENGDLSDEYRRVVAGLGFEGDEHQMQKLTFVKNFNYMPPEGFLMWHTNKYDNNGVPYRLYLISTDRNGGSSFKYLLPDGKLMSVPDYHGAVRLFKNTRTIGDTGEVSHLWHTVVSQTAHRHSLGFEILPELVVALLDSCDGCWEDVRTLLDEIQSLESDDKSEPLDDPLDVEEEEEELKELENMLAHANENQ